jgi:hypothetical protein
MKKTQRAKRVGRPWVSTPQEYLDHPANSGIIQYEDDKNIFALEDEMEKAKRICLRKLYNEKEVRAQLV